MYYYARLLFFLLSILIEWICLDFLFSQVASLDCFKRCEYSWNFNYRLSNRTSLRWFSPLSIFFFLFLFHIFWSFYCTQCWPDFCRPVLIFPVSSSLWTYVLRLYGASSLTWFVRTPEFLVIFFNLSSTSARFFLCFCVCCLVFLLGVCWGLSWSLSMFLKLNSVVSISRDCVAYAIAALQLLEFLLQYGLMQLQHLHFYRLAVKT